MKATRRYRGDAIAGVGSEPCLWLRGLLPVRYVDVSADWFPDGPQPLTFYKQLHESLPSGVYYTDASGGKYSSVPQLRKIGLGIVQMSIDSPFDISFACTCVLPGRIQTIPRGELYAILTVVMRATKGASICILSDSQVNVDLYLAGQAHAITSINSDLWRLLYLYISMNDLTFTLKWLKGYLDTLSDSQACKYSFSREDFAGNHAADFFADLAASQCELPLAVTAPVVESIALCRAVQRRLVAILLQQEHIGHVRHETSKAVGGKTTEQCIDCSTHLLLESNGSYV